MDIILLIYVLAVSKISVKIDINWFELAKGTGTLALLKDEK